MTPSRTTGSSIALLPALALLASGCCGFGDVECPDSGLDTGLPPDTTTEPDSSTEPPHSFPFGDPADFPDDIAAEEEQYARDMAFFEARREAYQATGAIPTVPPSLSDDPEDPQFEFAGYMRIATADEQERDRLAREDKEPAEPSREELAEEDRELYEDELAGTFVNDAGEMWDWLPRDLKGSLEAERAARGDVDTRAADESHYLQEEVELQGLRAVLGGDGRSMRSAYSGHDMTRFPWRVIGSLETNGKPRDQTPVGRCTASKYGERHLLSAAHCVFSEGGGEGSLKTRDWWPGADGIHDVNDGGDPTPNGYKNIQWYYYDKKYVENGWDTRDFVVLVLYDNANSCSFGGLGYRVDYSLAGTDHWNFGYPLHSKECPSSSPVADDQCKGSMWGMKAEIDSTSVSYVFHDHDTNEGQSGSPIYDYNGGNRQIVAHVKGTWTGSDNRGIKLRSRVFDFMQSAREKFPSSHCDW
ncbi:MAG: trypsin-like serine protease [Myxococcales bacterium]|nr:trypsin-like serine protease [Myxococcales bacterium]